MSYSQITLQKIRESVQTSSATFDVYTSSSNGPNAAPLARYTIIKHSPTHIQIIKHNRGTQIPPIKFTVSASGNNKSTCIIVRSSTKIIYKVTKSNSGYKSSLLSGDEGEVEALRGVSDYTDVDTEKDLILAQGAGAFFLAFLDFEIEEEKRENDDWVLV